MLAELTRTHKKWVYASWPLASPEIFADFEGQESGCEHHGVYPKLPRVVARQKRKPRVQAQMEGVTSELPSTVLAEAIAYVVESWLDPRQDEPLPTMREPVK